MGSPAASSDLKTKGEVVSTPQIVIYSNTYNNVQAIVKCITLSNIGDTVVSGTLEVYSPLGYYYTIIKEVPISPNTTFVYDSYIILPDYYYNICATSSIENNLHATVSVYQMLE